MASPQPTPALLTMTAKTYEELTLYPDWPNGYANQLFDELRAQMAEVQRLTEALREERDKLKETALWEENNRLLAEQRRLQAEVQRLTEALQTVREEREKYTKMWFDEQATRIDRDTEVRMLRGRIEDDDRTIQIHLAEVQRLSEALRTAGEEK
jgi:DNA repair exonuclease SbcCD ATPase subunit